MVLQFLPVILKVGSVVGTALGVWILGKEIQVSEDMDQSVSEFEALVELLQGQMTFSEFLQAGWPVLLLIGVILICGYIIATPNKRRTLERRARRGRL